MNKLYRYIRGYCCITVTGPASDRVLNSFVKRGIPFWDLRQLDELAFSFCIFSSDLLKTSEIISRCLCQIERVKYEGTREIYKRLIARPFAIFGILFTVALIILMQNYLLFFKVTGNEHVPDDKILRTLDSVDVGFATLGPGIKPKRVKDRVLNILPELQWITVTQNGSVAQVVVREREQAPVTVNRKCLANIVASKPAMIMEQNIFEGQPLKAPGDFVLEGEMLVSGVVDLEKRYLVVRAEAEIYGQTWYQKQVATPGKCLNKEVGDSTSWCIWLEIGKRRIKIFGNSRIYGMDCDKMIVRKNITLPGGYVLPAAILAEKRVNYDVSVLNISKEAAESNLRDYAEETVRQQLCAGEIINYQYETKIKDNCYFLNTNFTCREMIAEIAEGKWNEEDFQND